MHGWEWKILVLLKKKKISSRGPGATQALVGSSHSFLHLFFFSSASISRALVVSLSWRNSMFQSLELLKEKKRKFLGGSGGMPPRKFLKVETKICAIWGILEANLKKSSTLMFMMNISFVPSICIHRSIIFILLEKNLNRFPDNNC